MDPDKYDSILGRITLTVLAVCFVACIVIVTIWFGSKLL